MSANNGADAHALVALLLRCRHEEILAALESVFAASRAELAHLLGIEAKGNAPRHAPSREPLELAALRPTGGAPAPRSVRAHALPLRATAV